MSILTGALLALNLISPANAGDRVEITIPNDGTTSGFWTDFARKAEDFGGCVGEHGIRITPYEMVDKEPSYTAQHEVTGELTVPGEEGRLLEIGQTTEGTIISLWSEAAKTDIRNLGQFTDNLDGYTGCRDLSKLASIGYQNGFKITREIGGSKRPGIAGSNFAFLNGKEQSEAAQEWLSGIVGWHFQGDEERAERLLPGVYEIANATWEPETPTPQKFEEEPAPQLLTQVTRDTRSVSADIPPCSFSTSHEVDDLRATYTKTSVIDVLGSNPDNWVELLGDDIGAERNVDVALCDDLTLVNEGTFVYNGGRKASKRVAQTSGAKPIPDGWIAVQYNPQETEASIDGLYDSLALATDWLLVYSDATGAWGTSMINNTCGDGANCQTVAGEHGLEGQTHLGAQNAPNWMTVARVNADYNGAAWTNTGLDALVKNGYLTGEATLLVPERFNDRYQDALAAGHFDETPNTEVGANTAPQGTDQLRANETGALETAVVEAAPATTNDQVIVEAQGGALYQSAPLARNLAEFGEATYKRFDNECPEERIYISKIPDTLTDGEQKELRRYQGLQCMVDFAGIVADANEAGDYARVKPAMAELADNQDIGATTARGRLLAAANELGYQAGTVSALREEMLTTGLDMAIERAEQVLYATEQV